MAKIEALELRYHLTVTALTWCDSTGAPLEDLSTLYRGDSVLAKVETTGLKGKLVDIFIYDDDGGWTAPEYLTSLTVRIPIDKNTGWVKWTVDYVPDSDGLNNQPEWMLRALNDDAKWVQSERIFVENADTADPDGRMGTAFPLGSLVEPRRAIGRIDTPTDVDFYSFTGISGQTVDIDIDTTTNGPGGLGSYLRLFDSSGKQLAANNDAKARDESTKGFDSFITYELKSTGTYLVGVSQWRNTSYDPVSGLSDRSEKEHSTGKYALNLGVHKMRQLISSGGRIFDVTIAHSKNGTIDSRLPTWIVSHGFMSNAQNFQEMADHLKEATGHQVLTLDWKSGAGSLLSPFDVDAVESRIPDVATTAAAMISSLGYGKRYGNRDRLNLIGHSFGAHISAEIASRAGYVNTIMAIDPASDLAGPFYSSSENDFSKNSNYSWGFYADGGVADGVFGSAKSAATADESFVIANGTHQDADDLVANMFGNSDAISRLFSPTILLKSAEVARGAPNAYTRGWDRYQYNDSGEREQGSPFDAALLVDDEDKSQPFSIEFVRSGVVQSIIDTHVSIAGPVLQILGGPGNDRITVRQTSDELKIDIGSVYRRRFAPDRFDNIQIFGFDGADVVDASLASQPVYVLAGSGNDSIVGSKYDDTLGGGQGKDTIYGGDGDDRIAGHGTADFLYGGLGADRIYGDDGNDTLDGGGGVDRLWGGAGSDLLIGGGSNDKIYGGSDDDHLIGGPGRDWLVGETGFDDADADASDLLADVELLI